MDFNSVTMLLIPKVESNLKEMLAQIKAAHKLNHQFDEIIEDLSYAGTEPYHAA